MNVSGKIAIITGAGGGGQGRALALRLAREGATAVISDIDADGGNETVRRIEAIGGRSAFFRADVSIESDVRHLIQFAETAFGGLDILVNNAGPYIPGDKLQNWDLTIRANLFGPIWATLAAIEPMRKRGGGAIINFSSIAWMGGAPKLSVYATAKAGVIGLTNSLAREFGGDNIRVNAIAPGAVVTERQKKLWLSEADIKAFVSRQCIGRVLVSEDVARLALFLAADDSQMISKQCLVIDGGLR